MWSGHASLLSGFNFWIQPSGRGPTGFGTDQKSRCVILRAVDTTLHEVPKGPKQPQGRLGILALGTSSGDKEFTALLEALTVTKFKETKQA